MQRFCPSISRLAKFALVVLQCLWVCGAQSQDWQLTFDDNGNLDSQFPASLAAPQILAQPQTQVVGLGELATFIVVAADTSGLSYQWRFNGTNLPGATSDTLLLANVSATNEGQYSVVLSNSSDTVTSAPAALWIDSDGDGLPDSWELTYFSSLDQTATGDFDGDGVDNLQEFLDGTNPTNAASVLYHLTISNDGGLVMVSPDQPAYTNGQTVTVTAQSYTGGPRFYAWTGSVFTRDNSITLTMTNNKSLLAHFTPMTFQWTGPNSGDWSVAANWTPPLVPGTNDSVFILSAVTVPVTVTLNSNVDLTDFTFGTPTVGSTLSGSGTLEVQGKAAWNSVSLFGTGRVVVDPGAVLTITNSAAITLIGYTLENGGTTLWTGTAAWNLHDGGVITNRPGALFEVQNDQVITWPVGLPAGSRSRFDNAGILRKSVNNGTLTIGAVSMDFNNYGTVEIQRGILNLPNGGTNYGAMDVLAGSALDLSGGTFVSSLGSSITGAGNFTVSGGTANLAGLVQVSGVNTFSSGSANLTGDYICTNNTLNISGAANFNGTGMVAPAVLNLSGYYGTLDGSNTVTVGSEMNWTGGSMNRGVTIISSGATANVANDGSAISTSGRTLENEGTLLWTGAGDWFCNDSSVITNLPGALFEVQSAMRLYRNSGGAGRFDNAGAFRKSVSTGTLSISANVAFNNYGTVEIQSGIVSAGGGYTCTSNAILDCAIGGTNAGTGYGQLQVGGAVTLQGDLGVNFINGFIPTTNDTFAVLTAGTRNGAFSSFLYPSNLVVMQVSNTPNAVIVLATATATAPWIYQAPPTNVTVAEGGVLKLEAATVGAAPLSYQWQDAFGTSLVGQTNATLVLSNVPLSLNGDSFYLTVSNLYGSASTALTPSVLTVVPVPTDAYASAILGLHPAGYWPLQETDTPAPFAIETNYGTLGSLGNAYYAATQGGVISFGQGGALASALDYDPAVAFSSANPDSYAFVSRLTPSLTLRPPLSYEAWVYSTSTGFGDIIGEGGSGLNSPANSGNFGGIRMSYGGNASGGPNLVLLVYTGVGGTFNNSNTNIETTPNSVSLGQWHHCVATYDGLNALLYVDGRLQGSGTTPMAPDTWSPLTIGAGRWQGGAPTRAYTGTLDEAAVYTNVLSPAQVTNHYAAAFTPGANYEQTVLTDAPLLYYRMNAPSYVAPNPATYPNAVNYGWVSLNGGYAGGIVPGGIAGPPILALSPSLAAALNGVVSAIDAGKDPVFDPAGAQPFSAMLWFRSYPADGRMQTLMGHGTNSWSLDLDGTTGHVVWNLANGASVTSSGILNDGNWHYVAGVFDGTASYLYVDGALDGSAPAGGTLTGEPDADLVLGGNGSYTLVGNNERYFSGALAQVAFFTDALTSIQVQALYDLAGQPSLSVGWTGSDLVITYTGTLLSSTNVAGAYEPVSGAQSPYTVPRTDTRRFYRSSSP